MGQCSYMSCLKFQNQLTLGLRCGHGQLASNAHYAPLSFPAQKFMPNVLSTSHNTPSLYNPRENILANFYSLKLMEDFKPTSFEIIDTFFPPNTTYFFYSIWPYSKFLIQYF